MKKNMSNIQQEETLHYFNTHAKDWQNKVKTTSDVKVNNIQQRNGYVIDIIKERKKTVSFLDVGCGTGDLACEVAKQGINSIGVDFAKDMIRQALSKAKEEQLEKAHFECCTIFEFDFSKQMLDVVSMNGFIEYISQYEMKQLFDMVYNAMNHNGSFVVGSRNRLFNLHSLNEYTRKELNESNIEALLNESVALASKEKIEEMSRMKIAPLQNSTTQHPRTTIDVTTRFQYTPIQLVNMLEHVGFKVVELYPINIHGVPSVFKAKHPEVYTLIANLLQTYARHCSELVPFSSSFMVHAQKSE